MPSYRLKAPAPTRTPPHRLSPLFAPALPPAHQQHQSTGQRGGRAEMEDAVGDQPGRRATPVIEVVPAEQLVQDDLVQSAGHAGADKDRRPQQRPVGLPAGHDTSIVRDAKVATQCPMQTGPSSRGDGAVEQRTRWLGLVVGWAGRFVMSRPGYPAAPAGSLAGQRWGVAALGRRDGRPTVRLDQPAPRHRLPGKRARPATRRSPLTRPLTSSRPVPAPGPAAWPSPGGCASVGSKLTGLGSPSAFSCSPQLVRFVHHRAYPFQ